MRVTFITVIWRSTTPTSHYPLRPNPSVARILSFPLLTHPPTRIASMGSVAAVQSLPTPPLGEGEHPVDYVELKRNLENVPVEDSVRFERKMGDTELSYFLPSRESGVNDMYVVLFDISRVGLSS